MKNPYGWNRINLDLIYGRRGLLDELLSSLPAPQPISFALTGGRRMGKTTVLRAVEKDLLASQRIWAEQDVLIIPLYIDGLSLPRPLAAEDMWGWIYGRLREGIPGTAGDKYQMGFSEFVERVRVLLTDSTAVIRAVVLFDEIEPLLLNSWAEGFFANWRALLSNIPDVSPTFAAVFAGARELVRLRHDVGSPLMDVLEFRSLRNLDLDECTRLVREPSAVEFEDNFCRSVHDQTGGQPMLTQYLMNEVCSRSVGEDPQTMLAQATRKFVSERSWQFSDWWYKSLTPDSQRVYRRLPVDGSPIQLSELAREFGARASNEAIEILQHVGIGELDEETLMVRRRGCMFSNWQQVHAPPIQSPNHDDRIFIKLNELDPAFGAKYSAAWGILAGNHANYSGAVSEIRDTVTLVLKRLAPDDAVSTMPGFAYESGQAAPTRRQRARFAVIQRQQSNAGTKSLLDDVGLFESYADQFGSFVSSTYGYASGLTHTTSSFDHAYQALKQADSILAQLLC